MKTELAKIFKKAGLDPLNPFSESNKRKLKEFYPELKDKVCEGVADLMNMAEKDGKITISKWKGEK